MSSMFGEKIKTAIFGESHGECIGVMIDGLPPGEAIDLQELQLFLQRRAPGQDEFSTKRQEPDEPRIVSGLKDGKTCGTPLCALIENKDAKSADYRELGHIMRPSHADYPAQMRYAGYQDSRGGGHFSGRLTAPLCIAGGIALQILARREIFIGAHVASIGNIPDRRFSSLQLTKEELQEPLDRPIPVLDEQAGMAMQKLIKSVAAEQDSIGGTIECAAINLPSGIGNPMFDGLENILAKAIFAIPAVRGIEFGSGFEASAMRGSEHNDAYCLQEGKISTRSNHHGGIIGGISSGLPILFRVAIKPTPSIGQVQQTVDIETMQETTLSITGRHDPCIVPRAVPCVEAAAALAILDMII